VLSSLFPYPLEIKASEKLCHAEKPCHDHFLEDRGRDLSTKSGKQDRSPGQKMIEVQEVSFHSTSSEVKS
jgi:hypothetical protein